MELAVSLTASGQGTLVSALAVVFFAASTVFVWRSFYAMRIDAPMVTASDVERARRASVEA